jgi:glycosyltransferase involved in cell wall biosynthesis
MAAPTFSVIIASYNGANTLARAIDSVLVQSHPAHELIIVDDGSTDETAGVVAKFGDRVIYRYQPNAGAAAARNAGAEHATGEWLALLDADDGYYADRLRWHAEWIERDPRLDFLTGDYDYRRPDGSLINRSMEITAAGTAFLKKANGRREVMMGVDDMESFVEDHFGDTHTLSVPRQTFMLLGGYPIGRLVCEDVNFLIRLCAASKRVGVVCEPMGVYLIHKQSATRADPLRAQQSTVEALLQLDMALRDAPTAIRNGYRRRLRRARLNLAYALLRKRKRLQAMGSVFTAFVENPSYAALRDVASIARGCLQRPMRQVGDSGPG